MKKKASLINVTKSVPALKKISLHINKQAELRSKEILQSFFDHTSDGVFMVDLEGRVLSVNAAYEKMHGCSNQELVGKKMPMVPKYLINEVELLTQKLLSGEDVAPFETYRLKKDGSEFPVSLTLSSLSDADGNISGFVGVERDISAQKRAEQRLKESEERYRQLVELSPDPILVYFNFECTYANPAAVRFLGAKNKSQLLGKPIAHFFHPDQGSRLVERITQLLKEMKPSRIIENKLIRLDRQVIEAEIVAVPVTIFGRSFLQLLCRDVSDRQKTENALQERDEQYRRLLKLLPEPLILHDKDIILYINDAGIKLLGADNQEQLIGKSVYQFIRGDYHPSMRQRLETVVLTDDQLDFVETVLVALNGKEIEGEISSIYIYKNFEEPVIQSVFRDLTERKHTEELIQRSEKLSVVGQLAAGIAHEIRNPLTTLRGFSQLLKKVDGNKLSQYVDLMLNELDRINYIVNEFMLIAKPQVIHFKNDSVIEIVKNVLTLLQPQAVLYSVQIHLDIEPGISAEIPCDPNQLKQVFINLLKNAIEASLEGESVEIYIRHMNNERLMVRFVDHGKGIPDNIIAKLGEPFFTTKENGTGLGLMVCYRIIESHKGTLTIKSEIDVGTEIDVILPIPAK